MTKSGMEKNDKDRLYYFIGFFAGVLFVVAEWCLRTTISKDSAAQAMIFLIVMPFVAGAIIGFIFPGRVATFNWGVFLGTICIVGFIGMGTARHLGSFLGAAFIGVFQVGVICVAALIGETLEMILRKRKQR